MVVFDNETVCFGYHLNQRTKKWCAVRRVVKRELKEIRRVSFEGNRQFATAWSSQCHERQRQQTFRQKQRLKTSYRRTCWTWKRQDDGTVKAKSRIVLVGWKNPIVYQLECAAPTPTQEAFVVSFCEGVRKSYRLDQRNWSVTQDIPKKQANNKIALGVTHPSVGPGQLLLVETEIYGRVSGPSWFGASLTVDLLAAGYVKNPYDKCLFTLLSNEDTSEGQVLIDVDDFMEGGKETHRKAMDSFYEKSIVVANPLIFGQSAGERATRDTVRRQANRATSRLSCNCVHESICEKQTSSDLKCHKGICQVPKK